MERYEPSTQLVNYLLANGFVEDTHKTFPHHASRLKDEYDPHAMKRHFIFKGTREKVYFDYVNMHLPTGVSCYHLSPEELRSLIAYCRLSSSDRTALVEERYNVLSIPKIIEHVQRRPQIYSKAVYKRAQAQYEMVNLD